MTLSDAFAATPTFVAPSVNGTTDLRFSLLVVDSLGAVAPYPSVARVTVLDTVSPPSGTNARPSDAVMWPPNHNLVEVAILGIAQPGDTITITGVTQDEPTNGLGDGDTGPDAVLGGNKVWLRAERSGTGNGRVYRVAFTLVSPTNGICAGTVQVHVPHHKGDATVDDGATYGSTH